MHRPIVFLRPLGPPTLELIQLHQVKLMIRGPRVETTLTYSQTLNRCEACAYLIEAGHRMEVLSGPFLVSRTGDAG